MHGGRALSNNRMELTSAHVVGVAPPAVGLRAVLGRVKGHDRFAAPSAPLTRPARGAGW